MKFKRIFIVFILTIFFMFNTYTFASDSNNNLNISSDAAILMDYQTSKILYGKNEEKKLYPASTTKILTAILVIENCNLSDTATASANAITSIPSGYSVADIQVGEVFTIEQLLQALMVHSANDAANVLAEYVSGSIENFSTLMNKKSSEIGCTNSHFVNPSGKHDDNHYTTAYDLAIIMQYCMKNETFRNLAGIKSCIIPPTNKSGERTYINTNQLLIKNTEDGSINYYYPYAIAGKTGYTTQAKNCLVCVSKRNDLELISVVLGGDINPDGLDSRFSDSKALFEFGYQNYSIKKIVEKGSIVKQVEIINGTKDTRILSLVVSDDILSLINSSQDISALSPKIEVIDGLSAPILEGSVVGQISYSINGILYKSDLIASHDVETSNELSLIFRISLIGLAVLLILIVYKLVSSKNYTDN